MCCFFLIHHKICLEVEKLFFIFKYQGSARTQLPYYQKLRTRVIHIWDDRKGQPIRSAMERPRPGRTSLRIKVPPVPGKYAYLSAKRS